MAKKNAKKASKAKIKAKTKGNTSAKTKFRNVKSSKKKEKQTRLGSRQKKTKAVKPKQEKMQAKMIAKTLQAKPSDSSEISRDTSLGEVIKIPGSQVVLYEHHVPCISCPMASFEMDSLTVGIICDMYGLDAAKLIEDLNKLKKGTLENKEMPKEAIKGSVEDNVNETDKTENNK